MGMMEAKVNQYQDIRNSQGRKGRGKKKSADTEPDDKEIAEKNIQQKVADLEGQQLPLFN
jgi:hypothetical protein